MKLSGIEAVSPEDFVVFEDEMPYSYVIDRGYKENAIEVDDFPKLYTAEQMQEYAKEKVLEAYQKISNYAMFAYLNNHEPIVPEAQEVINDIFEEDTKND